MEEGINQKFKKRRSQLGRLSDACQRMRSEIESMRNAIEGFLSKMEEQGCEHCSAIALKMLQPQLKGEQSSEHEDGDDEEMDMDDEEEKKKREDELGGRTSAPTPTSVTSSAAVHPAPALPTTISPVNPHMVQEM